MQRFLFVEIKWFMIPQSKLNSTMQRIKHKNMNIKMIFSPTSKRNVCIPTQEVYVLHKNSLIVCPLWDATSYIISDDLQWCLVDENSYRHFEKWYFYFIKSKMFVFIWITNISSTKRPSISIFFPLHLSSVHAINNRMIDWFITRRYWLT